jgi:hypothetical protein
MRTILLALLLTTPLFGQLADLKVELYYVQSQTVPIGSFVQMQVHVLNEGPGTAANVRVTIAGSEGITFDYAHENGRHCTISGSTVTCDVGDLAGNTSRKLVVGMKFPVVVGTHAVSLGVTSATPDPDSSDNAATVPFETHARTSFRVMTWPPVVRTDPGEAVTLRVNMHNSPATFPGTRFFLQFAVVNATIEAIDAPAWTCTINGAKADCTIVATTTSCCIDDELLVTVRTSSDRRGGETHLTVDATSDGQAVLESRPSSVIEVYRHIAVTSTADAGPGTLRAALEEVNAHCHESPCKVDFAIGEPVPAEGWFTIVPETPFPVVRTERVILDGTTQTKFSGDTNPRGPEVAIDGRKTGLGLEIHASCDGVVKGFALGNFHLNEAVWLSRAAPPCERYIRLTQVDSHTIAENHIGVDPSGTTPWPNLRGLRLDGDELAVVTNNVIRHNIRSGVWQWNGSAAIRDNRIEDNGASGIFFGPAVSSAEVLRNTIANHPHMGVAVARGAQRVDIRQNSMRANAGLGIDWGLDGPSPILESDTGTHSNPPLLLSAEYDEALDQTNVTMTLRSNRLASYGNAFVINLYANEGPDGDGETPIAEAVFWNEPPGQTFTITAKGNHTGKWINATSTRVHWLDFLREPGTQSYLTGESWTSELSNSVLVSP